MNWRNRLIIISLINLTCGNLYSQDTNNIYIGGSLGYNEVGFYSIGISIKNSNSFNKQYQISFCTTQEFGGKISRFGYELIPSFNFSFRNKNKNQHKFYTFFSANLLTQYYQRNTEILTNLPLQSPVKRYGIGVLPGFSLNYLLGKKIELSLNILSGPVYNHLYGPACDGNNFECYRNHPEKYFEWMSNLKIYLHYKF